MYQMYQPRHMQMPVYQNQYVNQPQNFIKCQPVSSIEEARAAMIEFDGSVTVFTDFAKQKIYTKQIDLNGMAVLNIYELKGDKSATKTLETRVEELELLVKNYRRLNMNPMQILGMLSQTKGNPMQMMEQMLGSDPNYQRAKEMASGKTEKQLEATVRNLCQSRGVEFDQLKQTLSQMGLRI